MEPNVKLPSFAELLASISDSQQLNPVQNAQQKNTPLSASAHPAKPKPNKRPYKRKTPPATHPNQFNFSQFPPEKIKNRWRFTSYYEKPNPEAQNKIN